MDKINIDLLNKFKYVSNLYSNNEKTQFFYQLKTVDYENNKYIDNLYIYKDNKNICLVENSKYIPYEFYNENSILLSKKSDKEDEYKTSFYLLTLGEGEAKHFFDIYLEVSDIKKLDNENFVILAKTNNYYSISNDNRKEDIEKIKNENYKVEIDDIPFWTNGGSYINGDRYSLYIYNINSKELTIIHKELDCSVDTFEVDIENFKIAYTTSKLNNKMSLKNSLYEYDFKTKKNKLIINNDNYSIYSPIYTKNYIFVFINDFKDYGLNKDSILYKIKRNDLSMHESIKDISFYNSTGTDSRLGKNTNIIADYDNDILYSIITLENRSVLIKIENDKTDTILDPKGSIDGFTFVNNKIYSLCFTEQKLAEIYEGYDLKQITFYNKEIFENKYVAKPQEIIFNSNGSEIKGYVLLPENYNENKKYKAILDIHGGPKTVYSTIYNHEMQVWANLGYIVFFTNPHGSDGRGNKYADIRGKYGYIDYEDLMNFTDIVVNKYSIDKDNIAVTGGSYGGFMTNWIITHTNRFKCAVTQRSISNWISMYGVSDIGYYFADDQNLTTFKNEDFFSKLWEHSPIKHIKNCNTPTLIIHSENDYRCPLEQGQQLFTALKDMGIDSKMVIFKNENHELSRSGLPKARLSRLTYITNWFNKYLKK